MGVSFSTRLVGVSMMMVRLPARSLSSDRLLVGRMVPDLGVLLEASGWMVTEMLCDALLRFVRL